MAISVDLLAFYWALFERSCDPINALAFMLHTHYIRHSFWMINKDVCSALSLHATLLTETQGIVIQEPFRCSLGSAVQWYDVLQVEVDRRIKASLQVCHDCIRNTKVASLTMPTLAPLTPIQHFQFMTLHCPFSMIRSQGIPPMPATAGSSGKFISSKQSLTPRCCTSILVLHCLA